MIDARKKELPQNALRDFKLPWRQAYTPIPRLHDKTGCQIALYNRFDNRVQRTASKPNLALIGKRGSVQEPPNVKICPKLWLLATGSRHNEHIQMKFGL